MKASDKRAIALFKQAKAEREQRALKNSFSMAAGSPGVLPRVRLASQVDVSKADPSCELCDGKGVRGHEIVGQDQIPIICRCVSRGGGVAPDQLDRLLDGKENKVNRANRRAAAARRRRKLRRTN